MGKLRESIKAILENNMAVDDTYVNLYWANGPMGYQEGDSTPYVVSQSCCQNDTEFYEEYENVDDAIDSFLRHAAVSET